MEAYVAIFLCLVVPALSLTCRTISGVSDFNFDEFITGRYEYKYGPDTDDFKKYASATGTAEKKGDTWFSTFSVVTNDGAQISRTYSIDKVDGSTFYETLLNDGKPTDRKYTITVYAYKPGVYVQFYVCTQSDTDYNVDLRFAAVDENASKKLSAELKKEMESNDDKLGFTGKLIEIGSGGSSEN